MGFRGPLSTHTIPEPGKLRRSDLYKGQSTAEEQDDFAAVWKLMRLDEGLIFEGRWGSAKTASRPHKKAQEELGLTHYEPMGGGKKHVTGHSFRRSRGIHLLQHGRKREDIQEIYKHESWKDTAGYLDVGMPLWQLEGTVSYSKGVFALLREKLEQHYAAEGDPQTPTRGRKQKSMASSSSRSTSVPRAKKGKVSTSPTSSEPSSGARSSHTANTLAPLEELPGGRSIALFY